MEDEQLSDIHTRRLKNAAKRESMRREIRIPDPRSDNWQELQRDIVSDPEGAKKFMAGELQEFDRTLEQQINAGHIISARASTEVPLRKAQNTIDLMVDKLKREGFPLLPEETNLYVHLPTSPMLGGNELFQASYAGASSSGVHVNRPTMQLFLDHPDRFQAAVSHEMAHIANLDQSVPGKLLELMAPRSEVKEILADRMGALIHGRPAEYAAGLKNFLFGSGLPTNITISTHPCSERRIRMVEKWAEILEREGGTVGGEVIMKNAWPIFQDAKHFTKALAKIGQSLHL